MALSIVGCPESETGQVELTEAQKTAIEDISARVVSITHTLSAALPAVDRVETNQFGDNSICPIVELSLQESALTLALNYGEGCTTAIQGHAFISGLLAISGDAVARSLNLVYDDLTINDRSVDGEIDLTFAPSPDGTLVVADIDVNASDHGTVTGNASMQVNFTTGQLTMTEGELSFLNLENEVSTAVAAGLFYDPIAYGNLIPAAGTITFEVLNDVTRPADDTVIILVTFDANSPVSRTVQVMVGEIDAGEVTLPEPAFAE